MEAEGLSTVIISLVREHSEGVKPPRTLHCEFPLGRPLGKPGDAAFQRRVLDAAFATLQAEAGPVFVEFPEEIRDGADEQLSCRIPPRDDAGEHPAIGEARALRPAYDRACREAGRTDVGRLVDADGIPELLESFIKLTQGVNWKDAGIPNNNLLEATKDVMSYYEETATALAGHVPAARAAETWFFSETASGALLKEAREALHEAGNPIWFYMVPFTLKESAPPASS